MPIDRSSGGHSQPGEQEIRREGDATDKPAETPPTGEASAGRRQWPNLDNVSDEDLISFLGLDRTDRVPASEASSSPGSRRSSERRPDVGADASSDPASDPKREASDDGRDLQTGQPAEGRPHHSPGDQQETRPGQSKSPEEAREGVRLTDEQLGEAQGWLRENHPSPVEHPGLGLKTWGLWWDDQGGSGVDSSGRDVRSNLAKTYLVEQGVPAVADLKHHLEMKIAAKMRAEEGSTLRVYGHDGTVYPLFRGEA